MNSLVPIFQGVIEWIYGFTGDYGAAIVVLTLVIRMILIPVNILQRRQVEKQREVRREAEKIKEKFKKNERKQQEELQKLYERKGLGMGSCFMSFLQLPIMISLYNAIRICAVAGTTTVLLPWVSSLLLRDRTLFLPITTLVVQILPQTYPYIRLFQGLNLQKSSLSMLLVLLLTNSMFVFVIPAGVGLYYLVSGMFTAAEQFIYNIIDVYRQRAVNI